MKGIVVLHTFLDKTAAWLHVVLQFQLLIYQSDYLLAWPVIVPLSLQLFFYYSYHSFFLVWHVIAHHFHLESPHLSLFFRFGSSPSPTSQSALSQSLFSLCSCFRCMRSSVSLTSGMSLFTFTSTHPMSLWLGLSFFLDLEALLALS